MSLREGEKNIEFHIVAVAGFHWKVLHGVAHCVQPIFIYDLVMVYFLLTNTAGALPRRPIKLACRAS